MPRKFRLSPRVLTPAFWDTVLIQDDERGAEKAALLARLKGLEALRVGADYNTGSITFSAAWCLYSLVRHFGLKRAIEVGTFIGKSTVAMAAAMDDEGGEPGEVATCDGSNAITLPWDGRAQIRQFPKTTSTDMLRQLSGTWDFVFLDGRLAAEDVGFLEALADPAAMIGLDDLEGSEKGAMNLALLSRSQKFRNHLLIYPAPQDVLRARGFTGYSLTGVLVPPSLFEVVRQG
jgi:hypothetical protein